MFVRSGTRSNSARRQARGFILALTLWIIALFGLGVAAINTWVSMAIENARTLKARVDDELALSNAKNEIVYVVGTRPRTSRGIEVGTDQDRPSVDDMISSMTTSLESSRYIALDRRPYIMADDSEHYIQIQDGRGLINLNRIAPHLLRRLLALYDAPEALRNQLPDTLQDWIDEDDLTRLAGAEKSDYERYERLPPTNARLVTPMEAQNILGWDQIPELWEDDLRSPIFSTCQTAGFNPNTAPVASLLTHMPGLTEDAAEYVAQQRNVKSFRSGRDFMEASNVSVPNEAFFFGTTPGNCVIVDFVNRETNERTRLSLTIDGRSQNQPWQVDYVFRIPSQYSRAPEELDPDVTFPTPETFYSDDNGRVAANGGR